MSKKHPRDDPSSLEGLLEDSQESRQVKKLNTGPSIDINSLDSFLPEIIKFILEYAMTPPLNHISSVAIFYVCLTWRDLLEKSNFEAFNGNQIQEALEIGYEPLFRYVYSKCKAQDIVMSNTHVLREAMQSDNLNFFKFIVRELDDVKGLFNPELKGYIRAKHKRYDDSMRTSDSKIARLASEMGFSYNPRSLGFTIGRGNMKLADRMRERGIIEPDIKSIYLSICEYHSCAKDKTQDLVIQSFEVCEQFNQVIQLDSYFADVSSDFEQTKIKCIRDGYIETMVECVRRQDMDTLSYCISNVIQLKNTIELSPKGLMDYIGIFSAHPRFLRRYLNKYRISELYFLRSSDFVCLSIENMKICVSLLSENFTLNDFWKNAAIDLFSGGMVDKIELLIEYGASALKDYIIKKMKNVDHARLPSIHTKSANLLLKWGAEPIFDSMCLESKELAKGYDVKLMILAGSVADDIDLIEKQIYAPELDMHIANIRYLSLVIEQDSPDHAERYFKKFNPRLAFKKDWNGRHKDKYYEFSKLGPKVALVYSRRKNITL